MSVEADHVKRGTPLTSVMVGVPGVVGARVSALTANENVVEPLAAKSETVTVTVFVPTAVGVPEITPVDDGRPFYTMECLDGLFEVADSEEAFAGEQEFC